MKKILAIIALCTVFLAQGAQDDDNGVVAHNFNNDTDYDVTFKIQYQGGCPAFKTDLATQSTAIKNSSCIVKRVDATLKNAAGMGSGSGKLQMVDQDARYYENGGEVAEVTEGTWSVRDRSGNGDFVVEKIQ